jgi:hypothetical protein
MKKISLANKHLKKTIIFTQDKLKSQKYQILQMQTGKA